MRQKILVTTIYDCRHCSYCCEDCPGDWCTHDNNPNGDDATEIENKFSIPSWCPLGDITNDNCKYCCGDINNRDYIAKDLELGDGVVSLYIDGEQKLDVSDETGYSISVDIRYCSMCGKKL